MEGVDTLGTGSLACTCPGRCSGHGSGQASRSTCRKKQVQAAKAQGTIFLAASCAGGSKARLIPGPFNSVERTITLKEQR
ncbi:hypothetical protein PKOR_00500 [Pontibacter korlensis]|uniref:Uncharacterized protein n=1 Tax=Pontibacter korlensis TaxID=400092 RepID=A0A0E3ZBB7_9BACT|nr:hypothetical protein PKOR_00500 [Pontibacter korlensis]